LRRGAARRAAHPGERPAGRGRQAIGIPTQAEEAVPPVARGGGAVPDRAPSASGANDDRIVEIMVYLAEVLL
jgi:hypothetical protein